MEKIGELIKNTRKKLNLTQKDLSEETRIDTSIISRIESGDITNPSHENIDKIFRALGIKIDDLNKLNLIHIGFPNSTFSSMMIHLLYNIQGPFLFSSFSYTPKKNNLYAIYFIDDKIGFAAGNNGIWKTDDKGLSWKNKIENVEIRDIYFSTFNNSLGFAVGKAGIILKTKDKGKKWEVVKNNIKNDFYSISEIEDTKNTNIILITGSAGTVLILDVNEGIITSETEPIYKDIRKVIKSAPGTFYAITSSKNILKIIVKDNKITFNNEASENNCIPDFIPGDIQYNEMTDTLFILGEKGQIREYKIPKYPGEHYELLKHPNNNNIWLRSIAFFNNTALAVGYDGLIIEGKLEPDENNKIIYKWEKVNNSVSDSKLISIFKCNDSLGYAVGYNGTLIKMEIINENVFLTKIPVFNEYEPFFNRINDPSSDKYFGPSFVEDSINPGMVENNIKPLHQLSENGYKFKTFTSSELKIMLRNKTIDLAVLAREQRSLKNDPDLILIVNLIKSEIGGCTLLLITRNSIAGNCNNYNNDQFYFWNLIDQYKKKNLKEYNFKVLLKDGTVAEEEFLHYFGPNFSNFKNKLKLDDSLNFEIEPVDIGNWFELWSKIKSKLADKDEKLFCALLWEPYCDWVIRQISLLNDEHKNDSTYDKVVIHKQNFRSLFRLYNVKKHLQVYDNPERFDSIEDFTKTDEIYDPVFLKYDLVARRDYLENNYSIVQNDLNNLLNQLKRTIYDRLKKLDSKDSGETRLIANYLNMDKSRVYECLRKLKASFTLRIYFEWLEYAIKKSKN